MRDPFDISATDRFEYGPTPFWFWNDELDETEIVRQIRSFRDKGLGGFVIHPRVGLPRHLGWMSAALLAFVKLAVEEAARCGLRVILYDEGMYPSGSGSGQVVAENPTYQCRGLVLRSSSLPSVKGETLVANVGDGQIVVDRPSGSVIRGLHYVGDGPDEDTPPAADLLNPDAVACFVRLVYDGYRAAVGDHFGKTVTGIFTDEPSLLGRCRERGILPGSTGILGHVNRLLGYDFTPRLADAFVEGSDARRTWMAAVNRRLDETYYAPLAAWCRRHGVDLMGHPEHPDDIGRLRFFDVPGQDLVWRWVMPGEPSGTEGPQATQAKCSSGAAAHRGRRRNSNEFCGAYGHELSFEEMRALANWCLVRGVDWLIPHAFYYTTRGPRADERPPDVGPNSPWWDDYKTVADCWTWTCRLNATGRHVCDVAVLGGDNGLPWRAAKVLTEHQIDFNYLDPAHLGDDAVVEADHLRLAGFTYAAIVCDEGISIPNELIGHPALVTAHDASEWVTAVRRRARDDFRTDRPVPSLRVRHVRHLRHGESHAYVLFNEGPDAVTFAWHAREPVQTLLDPFKRETAPAARLLRLEPFELVVLTSRVGTS